MTLVNIDLRNQGYETGPDDRVVFYSLLVREGDFGTISTAPVEVPLVDGKSTVDLAPGPVGVQILAGQVADTRIKIGEVPPSGPTTLNAVMMVTPAYTPALQAAMIAAIERAKEAAVGQVDAEVAHALDIEVGEFKTKAEQALVKSTTAEFSAGNAVARVASLEAMAGLAPESPVDGQTANLVQNGTTLTRAAVNMAALTAAYDVPAPVGTVDGDRAAVIAACLTAKNAGREGVRLGPGHYRLDGVNVDEIHARFLIGDNVTFARDSHVYPFRTSEMAQRSVEAPMEGGRGAIAFEVDDADPSHWFALFPLTKELGTPFGLSWITGREGTKWVKEAARHGWELMSHLPYDTDATAVTSDVLDQIAKESVDALEWATGTRDGHGFVYPRHLRSLDTDRVLSKYFARGRAGNLRNARPMDAPNSWQYQAFDMDGHIFSGSMSNELKDLLNSIAASNSKMIFFTHWRDSPDLANRAAGFREMVRYARNLGIAIRLPKQLMTRSQIVPDPYMQRGLWTKTTTSGELDTTVKYHGPQSVKANTNGNVTVQSSRVMVASRPGMFTVARIGVRIKTAGAEASSATQGVRFNFQTFSRNEHGQQAESLSVTTPPIVPGPVIPAQDWKRHRKTFIIGPGVDILLPRWVVQNLTSGELWMDEFHIDIVDYIPELVVEGITNGQNATASNALSLATTDLRGLNYRFEPIDEFVGKLSVEVGVNTINGKSTDAYDRGKRFRVVFTPQCDHITRQWSDEGA